MLLEKLELGFRIEVGIRLSRCLWDMKGIFTVSEGVIEVTADMLDTVLSLLFPNLSELIAIFDVSKLILPFLCLIFDGFHTLSSSLSSEAESISGERCEWSMFKDPPGCQA